MESSAVSKIPSKFEADRKLRALPGELLLLGKIRKSLEPIIIKIYGSGTLTAIQEVKFRQAIEQTTSLKQNNLADIKDFEIQPEGGVVAFSTVPGPFLFEFVDKTDLNSIPLRARLDFLKGLAEVITFLQDKVGPLGTIHPANIIVGGRNGKAVFLDPGIGRRAGLTISGFSSLVTPYSAPEVITGCNISIASDVFSFTALSYLFLTGHKPFSGENTISIVASMQAIEKPEIADHLKGASKSLTEIFQDSLSENHTKRANSVNNFIQSVEAELISLDLLEESKVSMDFRKSPSAVNGKPIPESNSKQGLKKAILVVLTLLSFLSLYLITRGSNSSEIDLPADTVDSIESQSIIDPEHVSMLPASVNPQNFDSTLLPKLSQEELALLISHPLTNEELGTLVLSEANNRKILLRPDLFESALRSPHYRVKIGALKALEREGQGASLSDKVLTLSSDEDPLVRGYAARTLGRVGNSGIIGGLEDWLSKEKDNQIQIVIKESIQIIAKRLG